MFRPRPTMSRLACVRTPGFACALVLGLASLVACVDPHWDTVRWPAQGPGIAAQPLAESPEAGVRLRAAAIEWEPEAVVVELEISNLGSDSLAVELAHVMLSYGELEYGARAEPQATSVQARARLDLAPGDERSVRLRYALGRPLTGPGAALRLRGLTRAGAPLVDVPTLPLPPMPLRE